MFVSCFLAVLFVNIFQRLGVCGFLFFTEALQVGL